MSGTTAAPKITGFACTNGAAVASGATLAFRWNAYPAGAGADEIQLQGSNDAGKTWQPFHRVPVAAVATTKGGLSDGAWQLKAVALRAKQQLAGGASDPVAVRVGPAPAQPAPSPTPPVTPAPATVSAADFAALRDRVAALETAVAALKAQAAAPISASGTLALSVQGQAGEVPAKATLTLTPAAAPTK